MCFPFSFAFDVEQQRVDSKRSCFDGENPAAWLYRITKRQVRDFRRRTWIKNIFTREHTDALDTMPDDRAGPAALLERKQSQRILLTLLAKMNPDRRAAFMLFELDGLAGEEIARIQGVAVTTVWKRLQFARKEFLALVTRYTRRYESRAESPGWAEGLGRSGGRPGGN